MTSDLEERLKEYDSSVSRGAKYLRAKNEALIAGGL